LEQSERKDRPQILNPVPAAMLLLLREDPVEVLKVIAWRGPLPLSSLAVKHRYQRGCRALTTEFASQPAKPSQWNAFATDLMTTTLPLDEVCRELAILLVPHLVHAPDLA
jgi:hypothetical protein